MNSEFNDMERMFQEGLQNYEVTPPAHVWANIQKQKRRGLLFYKFRIAALLLALSMVGASSYYFMSKTDSSSVTTTYKNDVVNPSDNSANNTESFKNMEATETTGKKSLTNSSASTNPISTVKNYKSVTSKKSTGGNTRKIEKNSDKNEETSISEFDWNNLPYNLKSKNAVKLRYLIYPSLMQYVYTTKRIPKKYLTVKKDNDIEGFGYKYSFEIVGGPSYAFRMVSGDGASLRNESENANLTLQTGVKVNYHINPRWSVQTGLIGENRNEKIKYNRTEIQDKLTETRHQVTIFHPVLPPRTITVIDSVYSKENATYKFNSTNKYTNLSIPVVVGYNFSLGKLQYRVSAGSLFTVFSKNTATNLVRNGNTIDMVTYKESPKIKTSVYSAIALNYPLNPNCIAITELSYYTNITNRLGSDAVFRQRNYGINLSVGAQFKINK
jgi:tetrahydromethanopterin S-methyltransferase subunit B